jgi:hypothetical protein
MATAGRPTLIASLGGTKMLRRTPNGLQKLPVSLKMILKVRTPDVPLEPGDILFIPNSSMKQILKKWCLAASLGTTALYRIP